MTTSGRCPASCAGAGATDPGPGGPGSGASPGRNHARPARTARCRRTAVHCCAPFAASCPDRPAAGPGRGYGVVAAIEALGLERPNCAGYHLIKSPGPTGVRCENHPNRTKRRYSAMQDAVTVAASTSCLYGKRQGLGLAVQVRWWNARPGTGARRNTDFTTAVRNTGARARPRPGRKGI